jgi:tetratricopeptide (TPR) repeat protein
MAGYVTMSHKYIQQGRTDPARNTEYTRQGIYYAKKGADMDDLCVECLYNLSIGMMRLEIVDSAILYLDKAKAVNRNFPPLASMDTAISDYYVRTAWERYGKKGKYAEAIAMYKQALKFNPSSSATWYNIGGALYQ